MKSLFDRLTNLVKEFDNIILVGHKNPDLDSLGSCLGLSTILRSMNIDNYIFIDTDLEINSSTRQALSLVNDFNLININNYKDVIKDNTLLIVLDTHQYDRVNYPQLVDEVNKVCIIDHHIKSSSYIKDTELFYIDSTLSCVVELIASYSKYLNVKLSPVIATIMLAGMEIDTNGFNVKITEKTFQVAAYLVSMGADTVLKQNLLKESKDEFLRRADYIKSSYIYNKDCAICLLDVNETTPTELAEISESLLNFDSVEASFTIGLLGENVVGISARSLGNVDVCEIMKQLGGGGHATNAAVQVSGTTIKALENKLKNIIDIEVV